MGEILTRIVVVCGGLSTIATACMLFIRPLRERLLGTRQVRDGLRCQLRSDMLHTYYKHREDETIRQYELENFILQYDAYKALKGNSFIDKIAKEVKGWDVGT